MLEKILKNKIFETKGDFCIPTSWKFTLPMSLIESEFFNLVMALKMKMIKPSRFLKIVSSKLNLGLTNDDISRLVKEYKYNQKTYEVYAENPVIMKTSIYKDEVSELVGDDESCFVYVNQDAPLKYLSPNYISRMNGKVNIVLRDGEPVGRFLSLPIRFEGVDGIVYFNFYGLDLIELKLLLRAMHPNQEIHETFVPHFPFFLNNNLGYLVFEEPVKLHSEFVVEMVCPNCKGFVAACDLIWDYREPRFNSKDAEEFYIKIDNVVNFIRNVLYNYYFDDLVDDPDDLESEIESMIEKRYLYCLDCR